MEKENEQKKVDDEQVLEDDLDQDLDEADESIDWKAEALKARGTAKRYKTSRDKFKGDLDEERKKSSALAGKKEESTPQKKTGFDYAEKSYLISSGVSREDFDYLFEASQTTGKDLDSLLESPFIKAELKDRKEQRATKEATPSGSKRSGQASRDTTEYWIAKINAGQATVADIPDFELRKKVVEARMKVEKGGSPFTDHPVV